MRERPLILIVDDEPFNIDYLEQELEDLDCDTVSASNGLEALKQVDATAPDMILLDIMMPVLDGFQVLEQLKANAAWRDIPVVIISAMSDISSIARGIEAGAEDYLPKPFDPTLLEARLHAGLEKKRLRDQEVEYLRQVEHLTAAARAIEDDDFEADTLAPVVARSDALGNLGRVFLRMAQEVHQREQRLRQEIEQLRLDMVERREAAEETAVIYLPMDRRQALAAGRELPQRASGAVLFADVSGFTPLTSALEQALGRQRGAEEIVRQLNRVFTALVSEVHDFRGSVTGFSGDAMTCWFDEDTGDAKTPPAALRAVACALALQEAMRPFASVEADGGQLISLAIKVTVAAGEVRRFLVGDPGYHLLEALAGRVLNSVADGQALEAAGEVLVARDLAQTLRAALRCRESRGAGDAFSVLEGLQDTVPRTPWPELPAGALPEAKAAPWLLPPVYEQVRAGQSDYLAQLRPATALFLHFAGIDYDVDDGAGEKLDAFVRWVESILRDFDGQLLDLTIGDKGSYLYAVFGAPLALENAAARATAAALRLSAPPPALAGISDLRIGLASGQMRLGAYGSRTRRTYSALGEKTNLAARLMMAAAPILVDEEVRLRARSEFEFEPLPPIEVKGRTEPVAVFRPLEPRSRAALRRALDQLPPLLQTLVKAASAASGSFEAEWLFAMSEDEAAAAGAPGLLANLIELGIFVRDNGRYRFADPALRDTVYDTMLFAQRRRLHRATADWLETRYADDLSPYYEQLAYHYEKAEDSARTIHYLELAAVQARERGDLDAALAYFNKTLGLQSADSPSLRPD
ncbi:MAG: response regulator [Candidatus Promineifilaceae bacterium]